MATLTIGETIEVGGLAGVRTDEIFLRAFEIMSGDTVMEQTHIAVGDATAFTLLKTFDIEIVDILYVADGGLYCLGGGGQLYLFRLGEWVEINPGIQPKTRVSTLRLVSGKLFAMGPRNGLYLLDTNGAWSKLPIPDISTHILDIIALSLETFVICGTDGYLARLTGTALTIVELPTNVHLCSLLFGGAKLHVCGHRATLLVASGDDWELLDVAQSEADFLKLLAYEQHVLVAAESEILEVREGILVPFAEVEAQKIYLIADQLFAKGMDAIMVLRSGNWRNFPVSFEVGDIENATAVPRQ